MASCLSQSQRSGRLDSIAGSHEPAATHRGYVGPGGPFGPHSEADALVGAAASSREALGRVLPGCERGSHEVRSIWSSTAASRVRRSAVRVARSSTAGLRASSSTAGLRASSSAAGWRARKSAVRCHWSSTAGLRARKSAVRCAPASASCKVRDCLGPAMRSIAVRLGRPVSRSSISITPSMPPAAHPCEHPPSSLHQHRTGVLPRPPQIQPLQPPEQLLLRQRLRRIRLRPAVSGEDGGGEGSTAVAEPGRPGARPLIPTPNLLRSMR